MQKRYNFKLGETFGTLTIIELPKSYNGRKMLLVKCKCGNTVLIRASYWGNTYSCKRCTGKTIYPETRRSSALHFKGLRKTFLTRLNNPNNLNRGEYKKLSCSLTIEELYKKLEDQNFKCSLSGIPLNVLHLDPLSSNASIDRIDSDKNYTFDNIQWVHKDVNKMKNNFSQFRFIEICELVTNYKYDNFEPSSTNSK